MNDVRSLIDQMVTARERLEELKVIRSKKILNADLGEWFVVQLYGGTLADNPNQKDWDGNTRELGIVQVKAHAKSERHSNKHTDVKEHLKDFAWLIIIRFTSDYFLKAFYKIPIEEAKSHIKQNGPGHKIDWKDVSEHDQMKLPEFYTRLHEKGLECFLKKE